jgi:MFS family permease
MASVILLMILTHTAYSGNRLTLSLTAIQWHLPTIVIGLILSLISIVPMMVSISVGRWLDKTGTYRPLIIGCVGLVLGTLLPRLWPSPIALFISSALTGTGFLLCHMSGQQMTGLTANSEERAKYFGWLAVGFSVSGFAGPMLAGFVIDYIGNLEAFTVLSLLAVIATVASLLLKARLMPSAEPQVLALSPGEADGPEQNDVPSPAVLEGAKKGLGLLRDPELARLYLCVVLISSAWDVHQFLVPIHASKLGLSASQIGLVMGSFAVATLIIRLALPSFVGRYSHWHLLATVLFVAAFSYAFYPLMPGVVGMMLISFLLGLGLGCGQPIVMASLYDIAPKGQVGEAAGLRQSLINATQTVLPTLFGSAGSMLAWLSSVAGVVLVSSVFAPLFWLFSATALGGGVSTWRYANRISQQSNKADHES